MPRTIENLLTVEALCEPHSILSRVFRDRFHHIPPHRVRERAARIVQALREESPGLLRIMPRWEDAILLLADQAADTLFWELANRACEDREYLESPLPMDEIRGGGRS